MKHYVMVAAVGVPLLAGGALLAQTNIFASSPQTAAKSTAPARVAAAQQAIQTVKLEVDGMWCPSCGYIVRQALTETPGVIDAKVSMRARSAVVNFDSSKANVEMLIAATTDYGYPSRLYPKPRVVR